MVDLSALAWLPVNVLYGAATAVRRRLYRAGVFSSAHAAVPVISVGNISAGGTGKTPLVIWLATQLAQDGCRVCVLTRGYGRANIQEQVLVSNGQKIIAEVAAAGDEPLMIAEALLGQAAVLCNRDRVAGANWAVDNLRSDLIILDDGFQHFRLHRDLDLVTVDASRPFEGLMREDRAALRRADAIVLTRSELARDLAALIEEINSASRGRPVFAVSLQPTGFHEVNTGKVTELPPGPGGAFCGIGNPDAFFEQLRRGGIDLVFTQAFPDHAPYSQEQIDKITRAATEAGARFLLTTAKDEVKLRAFWSKFPIFAASASVTLAGANALLELLNTKLGFRG